MKYLLFSFWNGKIYSKYYIIFSSRIRINLSNRNIITCRGLPIDVKISASPRYHLLLVLQYVHDYLHSRIGTIGPCYIVCVRGSLNYRVRHLRFEFGGTDQGSSYLSLSIALPQRCRPERNESDSAMLRFFQNLFIQDLNTFNNERYMQKKPQKMASECAI